MIRKMDNTGRILIPKELREKLRWNTEDHFLVDIINGIVQIKKVEKITKCAICGNGDVVFELGAQGRGICQDCLDTIMEK